MESKDINRATREAIFALPDGRKLAWFDGTEQLTTTVLTAGEVQQFVTDLEAERDDFRNSLDLLERSIAKTVSVPTYKRIFDTLAALKETNDE